MDRSLASLQRSSRSVGIALARVTVGTLWFANVHWKRPPDFGASTGSGLAKWVNLGMEHPVIGVYTWVLRHMVSPHLTAFGWMTLLVESLLGALLILGWRTPLVGIVGAGMSLAIGLTVMRAPNEWPWAYFLMIAAHLLLAADSAGDSFGLDGVRKGLTSRRSFQTALGIVGLLFGIAGVIVSADQPFTDKRGSLVGSAPFELKLVWMNLLAALICCGIGVLYLISAQTSRRPLAAAAAGVSFVCALLILIQWRGTGAAETGGLLGGNGGTLTLWFLLGLGGLFLLNPRLASAARPSRP